MNDDKEHVKTLLTYIAYYGSENALKRLIEKHLPDSPTLNVALQSAIRGGKRNNAQVLLDCISTIEEKEQTLVYAINARDDKLLEQIYNLCGDFDTYDVLPDAIRSRNISALKYLVSKTNIENRGRRLLGVCLREANDIALSFFVDNFNFIQDDLVEIYKLSVSSSYPPIQIFLVMKDKVDITPELARFTLIESFAPENKRADKKRDVLIDFIMPYIDLSKENDGVLFWASYYGEHSFVDMFFDNSNSKEVLDSLQKEYSDEKHWGYLQEKINKKQRETLLDEIGAVEEPVKKRRM